MIRIIVITEIRKIQVIVNDSSNNTDDTENNCNNISGNTCNNSSTSKDFKPQVTLARLQAVVFRGPFLTKRCQVWNYLYKEPCKGKLALFLRAKRSGVRTPQVEFGHFSKVEYPLLVMQTLQQGHPTKDLSFWEC